MQNNKILEEYKKLELKKIKTLVILFIVLLMLILFFSTLGVSDSGFFEVIKTLQKVILGKENFATSEKIILNLRFPRIFLAVLAGIGLAGSGTIMQGITRNPLVSPFTVGISSSASFGASLAIVFAFSFFGNTQLGVISNAFIFSLICTLFIFLISTKMKISSQSIVLSGIALNYFFQALSTGVQFVSDDVTLSKIVHWTFGSLNGTNWKEVLIVGYVVLPCSLILYFYRKEFSMMTVNDDETLMTMGINSKKIRIIGNIISSLMTAAVISFTGVIGFVGLIAPHIARMSIGNNYKYLLPASYLVGSLLVLISDTIGRTIFSPVIIPVGIVISFLGVPIFLKQILSREGY